MLRLERPCNSNKASPREERYIKIRDHKSTPASHLAVVRDRQSGIEYLFKSSFIPSDNLLQEEFEVMKMIESDRCIKPICTTTIDNRFGIVMELFGNGLSSSKLDRRDRGLMRSIISQILLALDQLHQQGWVHADIKPENILLCQGEIKLCDMGATVRDGSTVNRTTVTANFRPPELFLVSNFKTPLLEIRRSVDIWSFGCTVYSILTGRLLFNGSNDKKILEDIFSVRYEDRYLIIPPECEEMLGDLKGLVEDCVRIDPSLRPTTHQIIEKWFPELLSNSTSSQF